MLVFDGKAIAIFRYFVIINYPPCDFLFNKIHFFTVYIFIIKYNTELIFANTSIIEYWFFFDVEHFIPQIAPCVSILLLLYLKKNNNTKNIDDMSLLIQK
jgi:hypothetical protein